MFARAGKSSSELSSLDATIGLERCKHTFCKVVLKTNIKNLNPKDEGQFLR